MIVVDIIGIIIFFITQHYHMKAKCTTLVSLLLKLCEDAEMCSAVRLHTPEERLSVFTLKAAG